MAVIDSKLGTKTWKDSNQVEPDLKSQMTSRALTQNEKDRLGSEDIGAVLNKVSDPNYIDPSKKIKGQGDSKMDKDAFFKLMMAQLKNQDPSNPLKNHEMAAQLAQFSTLEQMSNMNTTLTEIKGGNKPIEQFQALNLIGKQIAGDSARITRTEIDKEHEVKFNLPQDAKSVDVKILNSKNDVVRAFKFSDLKTGENKINWNGENEKGIAEKTGDYHLQIDAVGALGQKLNVKTDFVGVVSGLTFSADGPVLMLGKQAVKLKDIKQFSDPSLMQNDQKIKDITQLDLSKSAVKEQNKVKEESKTSEQLRAQSKNSSDLFSEVGMSNELIDQVRKQEMK